MFPRFAHDNRSNNRSRYAESFGELEHGYSFGVKSANSTHGIRVQLGVDVQDADVALGCCGTLTTPFRPTSFAHHIGDVVFLGADKQVLGIDARADIAMVADEQIIGDWFSDEIFDEPPMSFDHPIRCCFEGTVAVGEQRPGPQPTPVRSLCHFLYESFDRIAASVDTLPACFDLGYTHGLNLLNRLGVTRSSEPRRGSFRSPHFTTFRLVLPEMRRITP